MDETMLHCEYNKCLLPHYHESTYITNCEQTMVKVYISYRPYLKEMLRELAKDFEVIVFTSG